MTESQTYYHKATHLGPMVNRTAGVAVMVWVLLFFADVLGLSSKFVWLDAGWMRSIGVGVIVITLFLWWMLLRRRGDYVELDDSGIRHVETGGRSTRLLWTDVLDLRRNSLTGSFELVGAVGEGTVPIHRRLEAFGILMTDVISQLDRHRMRRPVSEAGLDSVSRPKAYWRSWWWQVGFGLLWLTLLMDAIQTDPSLFVVAVFGLVAVAKSALKHPYEVVVDAAALRLRFPFRVRQVSLNEIAECSLVPYRDGGRWVFAPAVVPSDNSEAVVLKGFDNQAFALYDRIQLARRMSEASLDDDPTPNLWQPRVRGSTLIGATMMSVIIISHLPFTGGIVVVPAARNGIEPVVRMSLLLGANVDVRDTNRRTALYEAAKYGHLDIVKLLVERGADLDAAGNHPGFTPVHVAAEYGHPEVVRFLLEAGADADVENVWHQTPLSQLAWKAQENGVEIAELLVAHGADVNSRDNKGFTPLHRAVRYGKFDFVRYLADNGADLNARTDDGQTVLRYAVRYQKIEGARVLLDLGANVDATHGETGKTELARAVRTQDAALVEFLLQQRARSDVFDDDGWSPLHLAVYDGHVDYVIDMLDAGADIELPGPNGTSLTEAVHGGNVEMVNLLLGRGARPDPLDEDGWAPLQYAAFHGRVEVMRAMLDGGADPNLSTASSPPPLWWAASEGHAEAVQLLWERGADLNEVYRRWTPVAAALRQGHTEIATLLRSLGATQ